MAEIKNYRTGAARLAARLDVLRSGDGPGPVVRGPVVTFGSGKHMVWLHVSFWVGEREIYAQDVMVQYASLRDWPDYIERLARGEIQECGFPPESPELIIDIWRYEPDPDLGDDSTEGNCYYQMAVCVEVGIGAGEDGVAHSGPGILFEPSIEQIRQFARELRAAAEMARLVGKYDNSSTCDWLQ